MNQENKERTALLRREIRSAIEQLCKLIDGRGQADKILAIGLVTTDDLLKVGASFLLEGDFPENVETYAKLSPVEWHWSEEKSFEELNHFLTSTRPPQNESKVDYENRAREVFQNCAIVFEELGLRRRYANLCYLTFSGVDPNPILEAEERKFVDRLNPLRVFEQWCAEFD